MSRICQFTGRKTHAGRSIERRGMAKKKGGVGKKITGVTPRTFKANIQKVRVVINGRVQRVKVSTRYLRLGKLAKPSLVKYNKQS